MKTIVLNVVLCVLLSWTHGFAQIMGGELTNRVNLLYGLNEPINQDGFNIEGNLFYNRLAFDYYHSVSLDFTNSMLEDDVDGEDFAHGLTIHLPYSTGFGVGYRFYEWLNMRVEPKWHRFELYYEDDNQVKANRIAAYTNFTLGLGVYGSILPFKESGNFLKGIVIVPSVRWWPQVTSTLKDDELRYYNRVTESMEMHTAREIGINNTAFILNISIGYSFDLN
ncbi:MAG: hypothetical protein JKY52_15665 [Flavobacteriales bacterium]|nr:hypothetical protein [Flavobacteriales bacterium]